MRKSLFIYLLYGLYFLFGIGILLYVPVRCGIEIYHNTKNPPSDVYAENQTLDKWQSFCFNYESEDVCEEWGYRLNVSTPFNRQLLICEFR